MSVLTGDTSGPGISDYGTASPVSQGTDVSGEQGTDVSDMGSTFS